MNETHWPYYPETSHEFIATVSAPPRARGFDTSKWNHPGDKPIDFQAAYDSGYRFWAGRLTVGDYYVDPWIVRDYEAASLTPIRKLIYHVPRAGILAIRQANRLIDSFSLLPSTPDAIVLDVETDKELGKARVTGCLREHVGLIRYWWTGKIILYTNLDYLRNYITDTCGLDLWIAWPASDKGYNPIDHPPVDNWRIYQRSWTHTIPGNPDLTVDLDEFNGNDQALLDWLGVADTEPPPEGDDDTMGTPIEDLKAIRDRMIVIDDDLQGMLVSMTDAITRLEQAPEPPPPPPPPPVPPRTWTYQVTEDKANAHYYNRKNAADKPIMVMIPTDERTGQPYKNTIGQRVEVIPGRIDADGPVDYFMIYGTKRKGTGQDLYLSAADGKIV